MKEKISDLWYDFTSLWPCRKIEKIYDFFRYDIPYGVQNLVLWFPTIWQDRNWAETYIELILRRKLEIMSDSILKCNNHTCAKADAKQMKACIKLIDRMHNGEYGYLDAHDKKWGDLNTWFTQCDDKPKLFKWNSSRPNANTPKLIEQERAEFMEAMNKEDEAQRRDQKALYLIMNKNSRRWWQ